MLEIKEIKEPVQGFKNIEEPPHYPKFEEIKNELTKEDLLELAEKGYNTYIIMEGGVIE